MRCWWSQNVATRAGTAILCALACGLAAASCTGGGSSGRADALPASDFGLPRPSDLPRVTSFVDANRTLLGSNYAYVGDADHLTVESTNLRFSPTWDSGAPFVIINAARAGFHFNLSDYDDDPLIELNWVTPPAFSGNLWIGLANWTANRWDWWQYTGATLNFGSLAPHQSSIKGIFVTLVLLGTDSAVLGSVRIGPDLWQVTAVDSTASVGKYDSLALDSAGEPHISYWDEDGMNLKYASRSGLAWIAQTLDSAGDVGEYTSMALDSADHPHISYYDATNTDLKYATNNGSGWTFTPLPTADTDGDYTCIAVDSLDLPHIAYHDVTLGKVCYASFGGVAWTSAPVATANADWMSLILDGAGHPYILYTGVTGVESAHYDGLAWSFGTAYAGGTGALSGNRVLAFDSLGGLHLVFYDNAATTPHLGVLAAGVWTESALALWAGYGSNTSLALDGSDLPHLTQFGASGMEYDRYDGSAWHPTTVDAAWAGWHTQLVLDASGKPCISYYRPADHSLCYAEYVN